MSLRVAVEQETRHITVERISDPAQSPLAQEVDSLTTTVVRSEAGISIPSIKKLVSPVPDSALADSLALFGKFQGDWRVDMEWNVTNGPIIRGKGEAHFGYILDGKAVLDVWTAQSEEKPGETRKGFTGTALRFYEPKYSRWRCVWIEPGKDIRQEFKGGQVDDEIILEGTSINGLPEKWIYYEIKPDSFRWRGLESPDKGKTWNITDRLRAQRQN